MNQPDCLERFGLSRGNGERFPSCLVHFDKGETRGRIVRTGSNVSVGEGATGQIARTVSRF